MKIRKKLLSIALALLMVLTLLPATAVPAQAAEPGSQENPHRISSLYDLRDIGPDKYRGLDDHYVLTADITLTEEWGPIGHSGTPFTGTFDGNWHTISGLTIEGGLVNNGLFGCIDSGAEIRNLQLQNINIDATSDSNTGGLVGLVRGGSIENCVIQGTVSGNNAGGLAGAVEGGTINQSYANVDVTSTADNCSAGGLVGALSSESDAEGSVTNSYAVGEVSGDNAGGLVGVLEGAASVDRSYAVGEVSGDNAGGLVGLKSGEGGQVIDSYYDNETTGQTSSAGGTGKTTLEMKTASTFVGWNTDTWHFAVNEYPALYYQIKQYQVTYDLNRGGGTVPAEALYCVFESFTIASEAGLIPPVGKSFLEWNTAADGSGYSLFPGDPVTMPAKNLTLYAIWETLQDGSEAYPFLVNDYDDLYYVNYDPDCHYRQTADIVFPAPDFFDGYPDMPDGCNWLPIGDDETPFTGSYDGGGFTISNLIIDTDEFQYVGLFGYVDEGAELKDINLADVNIVSSFWDADDFAYIGALAAYNSGTITNCTASGYLAGGEESFVGGIAGFNSGTIESCTDNTGRAQAKTLFFVEEEGKFYIGDPESGLEDRSEANGLDGWAYNSVSRTLTLDNLMWVTSSPQALVIFPDTDEALTIYLAPGSENSIISLYSGSEYTCGLEVHRNLIIDGTGTLIVKSGASDYVDGIYVWHSLQINGGTVTATAEDATGSGSGTFGIYAEEEISISGGTVTATAGDATGEDSCSSGICASGDMIISGGIVTATAGDATGEYSDSAGINGNALTVSGGTVTATGGTQAVTIWDDPAAMTVDIAGGYRYWTNTSPSAAGATGPVSSTAEPFVYSDTYKYIRIVPGLENKQTPSSPRSPSSPSYNANVSDGGNVPVKVNTDTGSVSLDLNSLSGRLADGENTVVSVPPISGVNSYTAVLPAASLSGSNEGTMTLSTGAGSVTIPGNMLAGTGLAGDAGITIGTADPSGLPESIQTAIGGRPLISLALTMDGSPVNWSNPDAPVTVSIPYTPTAEELANPESIVIWYIDGSGNVVTIPSGRYDSTSGTVSFSTTHFSDYAVAYNTVSFNDVAADAWYHKAVSFLAAREITTGTGNGNYSPEAALTRGDYMVLLMRAYGISPDPDPEENFADAGNTYYTKHLAVAKRLGISAGIGNNLFAPDKEITRQEMFALLYNALTVIGELPEGNSGKKLSDFSDASGIASWAKNAMTLLAESGTISGSGGKLAPTNTTTRAEMAQALYNLLTK